jgi:glycosyltransferase involved in cell wall biosynthesis
MNVAISVIVPVYNTEYWINECIMSIQNQTMDNIEIILVDDGSTDLSGAICDAYAEVDNRIKVIHQENKGVSSARNTGIKAAKGRYLMFCDSDDFAGPHWCESFYNIAINNPDAWISSGYSVIGNSDSRVRCVKLYHGNEDISIIKEGDYLEYYESNIFRTVYNHIVDRDIVLKVGIFFDEQCDYAEDSDFVVKYLQYKKYGIVANRYDLYYYRHLFRNSLSTRFVGDKILINAIKIGNSYEKYLTEDELPEYWKFNFERVVLGGISSILSDRCPFDSEYQIRVCQTFIETDEFKKWCHVSVPEDCSNPLFKALREGDFRKAYPYLVEINDDSDIISLSVIVMTDKVKSNPAMLDECINSLLNQTLEKMEIILVGDEKLDKYAECDKRIKVVHGKAGRNRGIKEARGKYIVFCDGNDFAKPSWCDTIYELALNNPNAWICTGYLLADNEGNIIDKIVYKEDEKLSIIRRKDYGELINTQIFNRKILLENNYNLEDDSFILSYKNEKQYGLCDNQEPFYCHRIINGGKENED